MLDSRSAPFGFPAWYPLLCGPLRLRGAVRIDHAPREGERTEWWQDLEEGESRLLIEGAGRPRWARAAVSLFRGSRLWNLARHLPRDLRLDRFHALPHGEDGFVLLSARHDSGGRAGLSLPGTDAERSIRYLRRAAAEVGLLTRGVGAWRAAARPDLGGGLAAVACRSAEAHRRVTARLVATRWLPERIVKIAPGAVSRRKLEDEVRRLQSVACLLGSGAVAPRVLGHGRGGDEGAYMVQEVLDGPAPGPRLRPEHVEFLGRLAGPTRARLPLPSLARWGKDTERLARARVGNDRAWCLTMDTLRAAIEAFWEGRTVPTALAHGTFAPEVVRRGPAGLQACGWEHAEVESPALHDLFHFVVQAGITGRRGDAPRIQGALTAAWRGPARALVEACGVRDDEVWGCLALYLFHVTVFAEHRNGIEQRAGDAIATERRTRLRLARDVAERLLVEGPAIRRGDRVA